MKPQKYKTPTAKIPGQTGFQTGSNFHYQFLVRPVYCGLALTLLFIYGCCSTCGTTPVVTAIPSNSYSDYARLNAAQSERTTKPCPQIVASSRVPRINTPLPVEAYYRTSSPYFLVPPKSPVTDRDWPEFSLDNKEMLNEYTVPAISNEPIPQPDRLTDRPYRRPQLDYTTTGQLRRGEVTPMDAEEAFIDAISRGSDPVKLDENRYRLTPGDRIRIAVTEFPECNSHVTISPQGTIRISNTQDLFYIAGRTIEEARLALVLRLSQYVRQEPQVSITILQAYGNRQGGNPVMGNGIVNNGASANSVSPVVAAPVSGNQYQVYGAVRNPGAFTVGSKPMPLSEAIYRANSSPQAGGFVTVYPPEADLSRVLLITPHPTAPNKVEVDVAGILQGKNKTP